MFAKLLIANRGEIACRVIRTCKRLGIETVAVYSTADSDAVHVRMADEAVHIGPAPASQSYLRIDAILEAAKATGAEAVHPGYGFLSENAAFARALEEAGIVFVGPPVGAIEAMGDKIESKKLAKAAGVSTVPGHPDAVRDTDEALRIAEEIGYPVMIKASAGGGGKGMRIAHSASEVVESFTRARSEAASSFGDDRVFLEKFVEQPRHIEIQVLADRHGNALYLGERECSIQRRHQKVVEEAPSAFLDEATRRAMGEQAVALARAVDYHSAGTVEFIVDAHRNFYFLEMNTRLQVEHPVTELVTGLDLVEQMLRVAAGQPLEMTQDDVKLDGWAIETRLYAEDPTRGFLPATGRLTRYAEPKGEGVRVDSGVREGSEVTLFYDPMIAKLCTFGRDRAQAVDRMIEALDGFVVRGTGHNASFLNAVMVNPRFREARLSTGFIAEEYGERFEGLDPSAEDRRLLAAIAVAMRLADDYRASLISGQITGWAYVEPKDWVVKLNGHAVVLRAESIDGGASVIVEDSRHLVELDYRPGRPQVRARVDDRALVLQADPRREGYQLRWRGVDIRAFVRTARAATLAARIPEKLPPDTSKLIISPMPGLMISIGVKPGQAVEAGQELAVLEAMKMENVLRAEQAGTIAAVNVSPGDTVAADQVLIEFS
ncbi:acetyl-CoA carboxylase biotin carboxylase subunit [Marinivivus vitaminiproducens]|uniref:acetyl-CoA carboxylase biotin carboxylase subunit n=1 Tax=Marinivivus vitaminiproducens TaxID=3035935 RepID=UPI0027A952C8|nr:acetyl/propionyl/methylcrotonyl-CoA carboxylase subunit alpha [Geminicoccaceae bacterium SCSIO 64248]